MNTKKNKYYSILSLSLGDGYLQYSHGDTKGKAYLDIAHKMENKDYVLYKHEILTQLGISNTIGEKGKLNSPYKFSRVWTKYYTLIGDIKRDLYDNSTKVFKYKYINQLDDWSLAILWMDDGCLYSQKQVRKDGSVYQYWCGDLATQGFSYESQLNILKWLETFNIYGSIRKSHNKYHIHFNRQNTMKLIEIVSPTVKLIPSMEYKINLQ